MALPGPLHAFTFACSFGREKYLLQLIELHQNDDPTNVKNISVWKNRQIIPFQSYFIINEGRSSTARVYTVNLFHQFFGGFCKTLLLKIAHWLGSSGIMNIS